MVVAQQNWWVVFAQRETSVSSKLIAHVVVEQILHSVEGLF
ncbi:MAG: hypothetical protein ACTS43_00315 [Candidatus Hodgkinia cicadicola]